MYRLLVISLLLLGTLAHAAGPCDFPALLGATAEPLRPEAARVETMVPGLYESIPLTSTYTDANGIVLTMHDPQINVIGETTELRTEVHLPTERGYYEGVVRSRISPDHTILYHDEAYLGASVNLTAPRMLNPPGVVPLVPGRGTPVITFTLLQHLRKAGVAKGSLREIEATILNAQTSLELWRDPVVAAFHRGNPGTQIPTALLEDAFARTQTGKYLRTVATQSGHRIKAFRVRLDSMEKTAHVVNFGFRSNEDPIIRKLLDQDPPLKAYDRIPWRLDLRVELVPEGTR